jgi:hypothetical protein
MSEKKGSLVGEKKKSSVRGSQIAAAAGMHLSCISISDFVLLLLRVWPGLP